MSDGTGACAGRNEAGERHLRAVREEVPDSPVHSGAAREEGRGSPIPFDAAARRRPGYTDPVWLDGDVIG